MLRWRGALHPPSNPTPCFPFPALHVAGLRRNLSSHDQTSYIASHTVLHHPTHNTPTLPNGTSAQQRGDRTPATGLQQPENSVDGEGGVKMADVRVPVGGQYNGTKGPGNGNGAAAAGYAEPSRKAHRAHHCLNFLLRLLTAMATAAALTTMVKSNQTVGGARARWNGFAAFKWFVLANAIVLTYATLAALASLLGVFTRRGPLSYTALAWLTFLMDFLLVNALMSAAAASTTIAWIGRRGQLNAGWPSQCGVVGGFCRRLLGALIACYIGWVLLALSTILAAAAIHRLRRRSAASY